MPSQPSLLLLDKRWRGRRERWVAPPNYFNPAGYGIEIIPERIAKPFVLNHHYSGTYPAARLAVGLFRSSAAARELVGVAVFAVGIQPRSIPAYTSYPASAGVELSRFVLLDDVKFNGETYFLARAFRALRDTLSDVDVCLSYADPLERRDPITAAVTKPAHFGTIYQAANAIYAGRARAHSIVLLPNGTPISRRALGKISLGEVGQDYARTQLLAGGARQPHHQESPREWIQGLFAAGQLRRVRHPGNHAYVFAVRPSAKSRVAAHNAGGLPYPRAA